MNKKVGLIPLLYDEYNYGGVLQFYALQYVVKKLGYSFHIVKMNNNEVICGRNLNKKLVQHFQSLIFYPVRRLKVYRQAKIINQNIKDRFKKIDDFRNKYYGAIVEKKISDSFDEYSAIVCGSDQIWNPKWAKRRTLLVDIPDNINKVIYAASMGCESMTKEEKNVFKPLVKRIQHVSVREESAKQLLDSFVERSDIQVVLDPTLLLSPEEWEKIVVKPVLTKKYLFTYFLGESKNYNTIVERAAKFLNLKIVNIPFSSGERVDNNLFGDYKFFNASPEEFIGFIRNAEIVFTDSFHACVFSILFRRKYFVFERKGSTNMIGRIVNLQNHFQLPNRIIKADNDINFTEEIDYSRNDEIQKKFSKESIKYLEKSIENDIS